MAFEETDEGLEITGCDEAFTGPDNLAYESYCAVLASMSEEVRDAKAGQLLERPSMDQLDIKAIRDSQGYSWLSLIALYRSFFMASDALIPADVMQSICCNITSSSSYRKLTKMRR